MELPQDTACRSQEPIASSDARVPPLKSPCLPDQLLTASDPNRRLLSLCPDLSDFWDGNAWIVTADRLQRAAAQAGIDVPELATGEAQALFSSSTPYTPRPVELIQSASLIRQSDTLLLDEILGENLSLTLELEVAQDGFTVDFQPVEANFDVSLFQLAAPKSIPLDRSIVGDALVERLTPIRNEIIRALADKVAQRNLVATVQDVGLDQPRYIDARSLTPPDAFVEFRHPSFDAFPIEEIARTPVTVKRLWIFEDCRQGFAVVSDGKRQYAHSENPLVRGLISTHKLEAGLCSKRGFSARLARFLEELSAHEEYGVCLLRRTPSLYERRLGVARSVLAHPGEVYVKSSRSSDGILVLRVRGGAREDVIIQSNSQEVGELLKQHLLSLDSLRAVSSRRELGVLERVALHDQLLTIRKRATMEGFLERAMSCMEAPIVEESIPVARLLTPEGAEKVECRLIFQGEGEVELVGHYAKASRNEIAANLSCGGHSRRTNEVIYGLHMQRLADVLPQAEIDRRVEDSLSRLRESGIKLARACATHYRQLVPSRPLRDFAIDCCPVWDNERGTLRFQFLEIQFTYGYSGLFMTEPPVIGPIREDFMAQRIMRFKGGLENEETTLDKIRRIQENLETLREHLGLRGGVFDQQPRHSALRLLRRKLLEEL